MYTGERATPQAILAVTIQQGAAAYRFVAQHTSGKTVLDVACGDGYGSALLADTSRSVLAIDRDPRTIAGAQRRYPRANLSFRCADVADLPRILTGARFDAVCAFQFIEHVEDQPAFLRLLRSFARPGGIIAVSTPNKRVFPTFNPYHVREVDLSEFAALFADDFAAVQLFGVFGDAAVLRYRASKQRLGDWILRADVLRARHWLPQPVLRRIYDFVSFFVLKRLSFWRHRTFVSQTTPDNFTVRQDGLDRALDFLALATVPAVPQASVPSAVTVGASQAAARAGTG